MAREYGYGPKGQRVHDVRPTDRGRVHTIIGALTVSGLEAVMCGEGFVDRDIFETYVEECLVPTLVRGDIVILDRLGAHRSKAVREMIEEAGAEVCFLPSYSPKLNPIEECWSKVKNLLRKSAARTVEELRKAIAFAIEQVTPKDANGWFRHAGIMKSD